MPVKHDPSTGQFTAGHHESMAGKHKRTGNTIEAKMMRTARTGTEAMKAEAAADPHYRAQEAHEVAAHHIRNKNLEAGKHHSRVANEMSRKLGMSHDSQMDRLRTLARDRGLETRDPGIEKTMHEFKRGALHSGSKTGKKVTSRKQAIAIGLSKQRRGDAIYQKAKRPTMLKLPSSPSADAATQWDRIRQRALDRGLQVEDEGTSEGAKKAAQTRKMHTNSQLQKVGVIPHPRRTTHYPEDGGHHVESASGYEHEGKATLTRQGFHHVKTEQGASAHAGGNARTGHSGRFTGGGFTAHYKHPSGITARHEVGSSASRTGKIIYHVPK